MSELSEFIRNLRENKPFLCAIFFISYVFGLFAFYCPQHNIAAMAFCTPVITFALFSILFKKIKKILPPWFFISLLFLFVSGFLNARIRYVYTDEFSAISYLKDVESPAKFIPCQG